MKNEEMFFEFDDLVHSAQLSAHQAFNDRRLYKEFGLNKPIPYSLFARCYSNSFTYSKDGDFIRKE